MSFYEHGLFKHTVDTAHVIQIQTNKQWTMLSCKISYFSQFIKKSTLHKIVIDGVVLIHENISIMCDIIKQFIMQYNVSSQ